MQAYLSLARARYSMGSHRVSSSQFGGHMEASTLVSISSDPLELTLVKLGKGVRRKLSAPGVDSTAAHAEGQEPFCILLTALPESAADL